MAESDSLPRAEEESLLVPGDKKKPCKKKHKWKKVMLGAPAKKLGPNWGPGKGYYNNSGGW